MQGQYSTSNAFLGAFYLRYEPNGINLRWIQNNEVPTDAFAHECHPIMDLLAELLSSPVVGAGIVQSLEERHSASLTTPFQLSVNISSRNGQLTNRAKRYPSNHRCGRRSSAVQRNILLRKAPEDEQLEYIMEENDGGEGCSLNGRRLYCKRRAPKDKQLGARCILTLEAAPVMHQASSVVASGLRAEYIMEENDGGEGCSLDGMHLYCKRKAPKDEQAKQYPSNHTCGRRSPAPKDEQMGFLFKPTGSCIDQNPFANDPSNSSSLVILLELQYIVEENDGEEGCSLDGKHLYYKRRAPEDEQLGVGLVLALETTPVMHQSSSVAASALGAGAGPSNIHQTIVEENDGGEGCLLDGMRLYCKRKAPKDEQIYSGRNDGGEGCTLDGKRLCCKRRAPEDEQLGAGLMLALETAPVMHRSLSVAASGLGASVGPSNIHQTIGVAGEAQHSQRNIRLRRAPEDEQLGLLFKPSGSFINQNLFANDSSNSSCLMISSGITEYIVEENDGGEEYIVEENDGGVGCSLDGRHLYYKRRAPEDEQLGAGLVLALEAAPIMHQPSSVAASGLRAGARTSDIHQTIGVAREA
ncbi:hypothetical protein GH714_014755 [Hevea brasiliensis]|uniref:Uncharacterized protein n=1 Tax=Hevea brasiliensis TaxID=3981 RepID=A0A6A6KQX5_HEVBR|nr:hypothetical protein GH714_014755 [Hevea brasiliensis]